MGIALCPREWTNAAMFKKRGFSFGCGWTELCQEEGGEYRANDLIKYKEIRKYAAAVADRLVHNKGTVG